MAQAKAAVRRRPTPQPENPKLNPDPGSNRLKDPDDWVTSAYPLDGERHARDQQES